MSWRKVKNIFRGKKAKLFRGRSYFWLKFTPPLPFLLRYFLIYIYIYIYLGGAPTSICYVFRLSVHPSVRPPFRLSVHLSVHLSVCPSVRCAPYLRNHAPCDHNFWYRCIMMISFFNFFKFWFFGSLGC